VRLIEYLELKDKVRKELSSLIPENRKRIVERDSHAKRKPIGCGLTIHVGYGCTNRCLYCYIQDMDLSFTSVTSNPLTGLELVYALTLNPYFVPGKLGTFLAFGSITEPFHKVNVSKTLDYMKCIKKYLGNPIQFSTKMYIDLELAKKIRDAAGRNVSPLVSIVTIKMADRLEPNAPPPHLRLETIRNLRKVGLKPQLFMRPVIPTITDVEADTIISLAKSYGSVSVVIGGFRITNRIINRLKEIYPIDRILIYAKRLPHGKEQIPLNIIHVRRKILEKARKFNLTCHLHACCACAYTHSVPCWNLCWLKNGCTHCNNECWSKQPKITEEDVREVLEHLNVKCKNITITEREIVLRIKSKRSPRELPVILSTLTKRKVKILK